MSFFITHGNLQRLGILILKLPAAAIGLNDYRAIL